MIMNNSAWIKVIAVAIVIHTWLVFYLVSHLVTKAPQIKIETNQTDAQSFNSTRPTHQTYSSSDLNFYTMEKFAQRRRKYPLNLDNCVVTRGRVLVRFYSGMIPR